MDQVDVARSLGVTEGEWVDDSVGWESLALRADPEAFLKLLPSLGAVELRCGQRVSSMSCVGEVAPFSSRNEPLSVHGEGVSFSLQVDLHPWHRFYAVCREKEGLPQHSLQVFDAYGHSILQVMMTEYTSRIAWLDAVHSLRDDEQAPFQVQAPRPRTQVRADEKRRERFREAWDAMKDEKDWARLLKKFRLPHVDALCLAGWTRARIVPHNSVDQLLEKVAVEEWPIRLRCGHSGSQLHVVAQNLSLLRTRSVLQLSGTQFNLSLRKDQIAGAWVLRRPIDGEWQNSLELYDIHGDLMLACSSAPGSDTAAWHEALDVLQLGA